ncbi:DNA cytosine methyltransferase [Burkholderia pseudomallei]|nr:DNA cytosine methyltransferase [Burkholderia pseudomallei]NAX70283.1 DNA cytosine methyltransferase [Burkholderia pseudomallei]NAX77357.1 DNA cytosine methyltransferase [Burkholderia pseudomallei]NAX83929.1 DNA cytosine methyltransferase [Burkholderia pseudomallei]NAX86616.1 DNA cytosine methyltransferase [Burkholderia pseudomallei]
MNELHLFAGAGGGILAGQLRGNRCVCAVEFDPYAQAVLVARQNDGTFPAFPIWDDVRTFDGRPWRGIVDIVAGGFPCQDVSAAGTGDGIDGERSGLWTEMARIIREVRPFCVEVENSPMLTSRGLGRVLGDLASMGFDAEWGVLSAADTDAPHLRERIWIRGYVADAYRAREPQHAVREREQRIITGGAEAQEREGSFERSDRPRGYGFGRWPAEPGMGRVVDGMAHRAHRIRTLGNGQVPRVAATAFTLLKR